MAVEYVKKFEELTNLVLKMAGGVDGLRMEMRDRRSEGQGLRAGLDEVRIELRSLGGQFTKNTASLTSVEVKLSNLSDQFNDIAVMAIKDNNSKIVSVC